MIPRGNTSISDDVVRFARTPTAADLSVRCPRFLDSINDRVAQGKRQANLAINQELISTYWQMGRDILARQTEQGWGSKVIDRLPANLRERYPDAKGFSPRHLKYMRSFAEAWSSEANVQQPVAQLPWGHNLVLLDKLNGHSTRLRYARMALSEGWSRNRSVRQIETRLHERSGQATSNFNTVLASPSSLNVQNATQGPHVFDFLELTEAHNERDLEALLSQHVESFLLELGRGIAFVGRQLRLDIAGDEFFPGLDFYNSILRRFVIVDLKAGKFEPGYFGQLGMYMSAVDDLRTQPEDEPTIGLLLCKSKNSVVAEYALRGFNSPISVAEWATELKESLLHNISRDLPSIDELEAELADYTKDGK